MDPKLKDDYDWEKEYPQYHAWQTIDMEKNGTTFQLPLDTKVKDGIIMEEGLHPNHRLLYEFMLKQQPASVLEVGCGYCNHLLSISRILPDTELYGCDISQRQLMGAQRKYGAEVMAFSLMWGDFTEVNIDFQVDIVYSQAVLMHMSTERARLALEKMCKVATKYVVSIDGGLIIPDLEDFLGTLGTVTMLTEFAEKHWDTYVAPPFIIEV